MYHSKTYYITRTSFYSNRLVLDRIEFLTYNPILDTTLWKYAVRNKTFADYRWNYRAHNLYRIRIMCKYGHFKNGLMYYNGAIDEITFLRLFFGILKSRHRRTENVGSRSEVRYFHYLTAFNLTWISLPNCQFYILRLLPIIQNSGVYPYT